MALLVVDVFTHGVVMSADSQPVEILGGENRILRPEARLTRDPILQRVGGGFVGLVGFAGTEEIEGVTTREWQRRLTKEMERARRVLDRALRVANTAEVEANAEILEGSPRQRIVEFVRDRHAQLVVVGSRRRRLGRSVALAVARAADRPVMVAAPPASRLAARRPADAPAAA